VRYAIGEFAPSDTSTVVINGVRVALAEMSILDAATMIVGSQSDCESGCHD